MQTASQPREQWEYFPQPPFTYDQRFHTTVLFGGLTFKHDRLIKGALRALGYRSATLTTPNVADFQAGKEYGNYGQCNPTYFTVGNLVNTLKTMEKEGIPRQQILDDFVFVTASSPCGPCRFGMYKNEYRLATSNAGYEGFRVLTFEQGEGFGEAVARQGLEVNLDFMLAFLLAVTLGDVLNEVAYALRPFEESPGQTDLVLERALQLMEEELAGLEPRPVPAYLRPVESAAKVYRATKGMEAQRIFATLEKIGAMFDEVLLDRTRFKPVVKITGEFWAQTTEGDGNFNMFQFLEREGAQVLVEPIATWAHYMLDQAKMRAGDRKGIVEGKEATGILPRIKSFGEYWGGQAAFSVAEVVFKGLYRRMGKALLGIPHELVDQRLLAEISHQYYDTRAEGGEGHLEVGKTIYYSRKGLCHMVLSLKPFGCMPSTQSDGVQAAVQGAYGDLIFLPIETSGEGEVNAHSRVQMALGEAKKKAREEYQTALSTTGLSEKQVKEYVEAHPELKRPSYHVPQHETCVGVAANLVYHVKDRLHA